MKLGILCLLALLAVAPGAAVAVPPAPVRPLTNVHAHNDYAHPRPLRDALDNGFCSIEADVHLVDGKLLVAHDAKDVRPERTLEALYLAPLQKRAHANGGRIYRNGPVSLLLLVDLKTDAAPTYAALRLLLARYKDILTEFGGGKTTPRAVTVVLSGNRPTLAQLSAEPQRYVAYDGRLSDLDHGISPALMPLVSQNWSAVSLWKGEAGTSIPDADRRKIEAIAAKAHAQGYRLRFWGTPDTKAMWRATLAMKIDLVNTDDLAGLREFLSAEKPHP